MLDSAEKVPTVLPQKSDWKKQSSTNYRRSPKLEAIDKAVGAYHQVAADNYVSRIGLSKQLLEKIRDWRESKLVDGRPSSVRLTAVEGLRAKVEAEQQKLEAEKLRLAQQRFANLSPEKVAVYSMGVLLDNDGNFIEESKQAYDKKKSTLETPGDEIAIRLALLEDELRLAHAKLEQKSGFGKQTIGLFTMPEWAFKQPGTPFSEQEKLRIQAACLAFSEKYPNMLLVPGSTVWTKKGYDGPELRATASVFFNGELIHETHKQNMIGDASGYLEEGSNKRQMENKWRGAWDRAAEKHQDSCFFRLGNRLLALEICGDHMRASKEHHSSSTLTEDADIHILVAKGMGFSSHHVNLREGGIGVANDASVSPAENGKPSASGIRTVISGQGRIKHSGSGPLFWEQKGQPVTKRQYTQASELASSYLGTHKLPVRHY